MDELYDKIDHLYEGLVDRDNILGIIEDLIKSLEDMKEELTS